MHFGLEDSTENENHVQSSQMPGCHKVPLGTKAPGLGVVTYLVVSSPQGLPLLVSVALWDLSHSTASMG